jgi:trk system potassium uptake protein TrkH
MNDKSNFIFMGLMTIGASSGSFAGGIMKLTAFMYIFLYLFSHFVGSHKIRSPKNYIVLSEKTKVEANLRLMGFSFITIVIVILMFFSQPDIKGIWLLFEAISGVTNTGLTMGATPLLNAFEMILVIILMTIGKVGFISATISFFPKLQSLLEASEHSEDEFPVD